MRIDSHQHFWKFDPIRDVWINEDMKIIQRDFLPSDLKPLLKANQIDGCVAVQADQSEKETDFLLSLAEQNSFIKGVVGWVDLQEKNLETKLEKYSSNAKLKGMRHIVQAEADDFMLNKAFQKGISMLGRFGLCYDILVFSITIGGSHRTGEEISGSEICNRPYRQASYQRPEFWQLEERD